MRLAELGEAISHWIEFKGTCGFEQLLSEALLMVPLSEYLIGKGWTVSAERDYRTIFDKGRGEGYLSYDIDAVCNGVKIIAEAKYLKTVKGQKSGSAIGVNRVFEDIAKLAFPIESCRRLLIIGKAANVSSLSDVARLVEQRKSIVNFPEVGVIQFGERRFVMRESIPKAMALLQEGVLPKSCEVELMRGAGETSRAFVFEIRRLD